jgi:hypothetical protein
MAGASFFPRFFLFWRIFGIFPAALKKNAGNRLTLCRFYGIYK